MCAIYEFVFLDDHSKWAFWILPPDVLLSRTRNGSESGTCMRSRRLGDSSTKLFKLGTMGYRISWDTSFWSIFCRWEEPWFILKISYFKIGHLIFSFAHILICAGHVCGLIVSSHTMACCLQNWRVTESKYQIFDFYRTNDTGWKLG